MRVSPDPTINGLGTTEATTGVTGAAATASVVAGEVPPPGAGFVTVTVRVPAVAWSATVATNVRVVAFM